MTLIDTGWGKNARTGHPVMMVVVVIMMVGTQAEIVIRRLADTLKCAMDLSAFIEMNEIMK
jgi:hypothetical protein